MHALFVTVAWTVVEWLWSDLVNIIHIPILLNITKTKHITWYTTINWKGQNNVKCTHPPQDQLYKYNEVDTFWHRLFVQIYRMNVFASSSSANFENTDAEAAKMPAKIAFLSNSITLLYNVKINTWSIVGLITWSIN